MIVQCALIATMFACCCVHAGFGWQMCAGQGFVSAGSASKPVNTVSTLSMHFNIFLPAEKQAPQQVSFL